MMIEGIKRWRWALLIALLLAAGLIFAFRPEAALVDAGKVTRGPMSEGITDDGVTRAREFYVVSAPVTGYMSRIELEVGVDERDDGGAPGAEGAAAVGVRGSRHCGGGGEVRLDEHPRRHAAGRPGRCQVAERLDARRVDQGSLGARCTDIGLAEALGRVVPVAFVGWRHDATSAVESAA